ncbi:Chemotaxis signal transduction protein [Paraburkholderia tropica]|uniref:chemotaxis protein CheW n=1 Tax=Paraburkholderia tropica TaxID=92647 RepID=UPI001CB5BC60|nr:chemotaxis protein CheW [Paraburkholderia tropica]CAG9204079.1 Chemotaxis signal transduction protein [Paraburkholderia tropica]
MREAHAMDDVNDLNAPQDASQRVPFDACWKSIGVLGDNSCPKLAEYIRCLNCPVFEQAAARMLDRPARHDLRDDVRDVHDSHRQGESSGLRNNHASRSSAGQTGSLVFRVGAEWLALPAQALRYVGESRPVHSLPHRRSPAVLGVVNVRGVLTLAASLAELLHIDASASATTSTTAARAATPRLLVTEWGGETTAFPVDDVDGVAWFGAEELLPAPATLAHAAGRHVRGVFVWRGRSVGVLEPDALFGALARSLR